MNTQDDRIRLWQDAKLFLKEVTDIVPVGMSEYIALQLRAVYSNSGSWVKDTGPGGVGLSWSATCLVDDLLKEPMRTNDL